MPSITINPNEYPIRETLPILLVDRTTQSNILLATDSYDDLGDFWGANMPIIRDNLFENFICIIQPRVLKSLEEQSERTRKKAEVFTPAWICCLMNNHCDEEWFGQKNVFNHLEGQSWTVTEGPIRFLEGKKWQSYVDSRRLEITCGEAPFLVSRYDMGTGKIIPVQERVGILDRKIRIVTEHTKTEDSWIKWVTRAYQSVYGYEYQGDNLFVARVNLLLSYVDYMQDRWNRDPTTEELQSIAKVISWNIWQMNGLNGCIPVGPLYDPSKQVDFVERLGNYDDGSIPCHIYDWREKKKIAYNAFREGRSEEMKFDYIIGNPPYNEDFNNSGDNKTYAAPIYDKFIDGAYAISNCVELIHPARFLSKAGSTPKAWNEKMLNDPHLKIVFYESDARKVFSNTDIKGGIVVTYHDVNRIYGAIEVFTQFHELNSILRAVRDDKFISLSSILVSGYAYHFTQKMYDDHPEFDGIMSKGHKFDLKSNVFDTMYNAFSVEKKDNYIGILGRKGNSRIMLFIDRLYINNVVNLDKYKVFIPRGSGRGDFGEVMSTPIIGRPGEGATETFLSIGSFDTLHEAENTIKYIKTKMARTLLSILKTTQLITPGIWKYVPLQDFTPASDIDWSQSVAGIDRQLYAKYGLSDDEITFIETHVKEMQ